MQSFLHWIATGDNLLAAMVTACVAVLVVCCLECSKCPSRDEDDIFRRRRF
ncbi:MAG: hypothetical protein ABSF70_15265 [Terracidiphilus sp.]|jgi:hypothetical protein